MFQLPTIHAPTTRSNVVQNTQMHPPKVDQLQTITNPPKGEKKSKKTNTKEIKNKK